jgi:D-sedoheptulose 7-phosphate isomerase
MILSLDDWRTCSRITAALIVAFTAGNKLLLCGNGGSAADAEHVATEMMCCFRERSRAPLPAISLASNLSLITAIANDYSFTEVFSRQVEALGKAGDILWTFSTSSKSVNVLRAMREAKHQGMYVVGFTGQGDNQVFVDLCHECFRAASEDTAEIQEYHRAAYHEICYAVEEEMFPCVDE